MINRREFLKLLGLGSGAGILAGIGISQLPAKKEELQSNSSGMMIPAKMNEVQYWIPLFDNDDAVTGYVEVEL